MYELEYLDVKENKMYNDIIDKVLEECFKEENLQNSKMIVEITLTTSGHIRIFNKKFRNMDKSTDVLSFPMFEKNEIDEMISNQEFQHEDILGDMIISIEQVEKQAEEYGHSFEREFSYMIVHSFYHLMGYDHIEEEDKKIMRPKEENILNKLGITRS